MKIERVLSKKSCDSPSHNLDQYIALSFLSPKGSISVLKHFKIAGNEVLIATHRKADNICKMPSPSKTADTTAAEAKLFQTILMNLEHKPSVTSHFLSTPSLQEAVLTFACCRSTGASLLTSVATKMPSLHRRGSDKFGSN